MASKAILIQNARLRSGEFTDILIEDGKFAQIRSGIEAKEQMEVINAEGHMVTAPFCDPHLHLDATLSVGKPRFNMSGTLMEGIQVWGERMGTLTKEVVKRNAIDVVEWEVANGSMFLRTHVDATEPTGLVLEALLEVRDEVKDIADLQIVAFPQECMFSFPGNDKLVEKAMQMGCDVVGGLPYFELSPEDGLRDVKYAFDLAEKYDAMVDIHCDENTDDQSRYVEAMARETIVRGMEGRVTASHTTAMHNYDNDYAAKVIGNIKRAQMNMITNPYANSCLQNRRDGYPRRRGHTRVDELLEAGVNVSIGSDDIMDPWFPMGKGSPLAAAGLLMCYAQLSGYRQISQLVDMVSVNSAKTMMIEGYGIQEGNPANLVILDAESDFDAVRLTAEALYVIRKGEIISKTVPAERIVKSDVREKKIDFKVTEENK